VLEATNMLRGPFAVRSSAAVEDRIFASWAGQFLTILGVQSTALPRSILRCWSSIFTASASSYAKVFNIDLRKIMMAVIIQEMTNPLWAGVLFTGMGLNRKHDRNSLLLEAVRGLGERLVSGASSPELRAEAQLTKPKVI